MLRMAVPRGGLPTHLEHNTTGGGLQHTVHLCSDRWGVEGTLEQLELPRQRSDHKEDEGLVHTVAPADSAHPGVWLG